MPHYIPRMTRLDKTLPFLGVFLLIFLAKGEAMSLLPSPQEVVLSSPLEGTLLYEGKPVPDVRIERNLRWFDGEESYDDFVVTDSNGYFSLPVVERTLKLSALTPLIVSQEFSVISDGERIVIWYLVKDSKSEYSELGGKPVNVLCELTNDERMTQEYKTPIMTRCTWDSLEPWIDTE